MVQTIFEAPTQPMSDRRKNAKEHSSSLWWPSQVPKFAAGGCIDSRHWIPPSRAARAEVQRSERSIQKHIISNSHTCLWAGGEIFKDSVDSNGDGHRTVSYQRAQGQSFRALQLAIWHFQHHRWSRSWCWSFFSSSKHSSLTM